MATQKIVQQKAEQAFNEIDGLLEQELPNTSTVSDINSDRNKETIHKNQKIGVSRHNNSFIQINMEPSPELMQSIIDITVDK